MKRLGILLIILQQVCFSIETATIHHIGHSLSLMQLALLRSVGGLLIVMVLWRSAGLGWSIMKTSQLGIQVLRSAVSIGYMFVLMYSFSYLPLADATALSYTQAFWIILLAPWLLREVVPLQRYLAVVIGLSGALIVIRPSFSHTAAAYVLVLLGTSLNGLAVILTRYLQRLDHPITVMAWVNLLMCLFFSAALWEPWPILDHNMLWLLSVLLIGPLGTYLGIVAVHYAEASALAPLTYIRLVIIGLIAPVLFGEPPTLRNVVGATIIALACGMSAMDINRRSQPI